MAPRYTVRAVKPGFPVVVTFKDGTEEPEALAGWAARQFPGCYVTITDEYAHTVEQFAPPTTKRFTMDGEPITLAELAEHNAHDEELPEWLTALEALPVGGEFLIGGGAFAEFIFKREA